jgi:hypothetical protein
MGTKKDYTPYREQLIKDWNNLLKEYNVNPFEGQDKIPERYRKPYNILYSVFVLGYSVRRTAELAGLTHTTLRQKYIDRYISTYEKYALLGRIPENVNILKEAFGGRKRGRPRKDYEELAKELKGNPLLWDRLIKAIFTYRLRGKDEKPIFVSLEKVRKQLAPVIEEFLGTRLNQKDLWAKFVNAVIRVEWDGSPWRPYAKVLPYRVYVRVLGSQRAKMHKLPEVPGAHWEWEADITEVKVDGKHFYLLAVMDSFTRVFLGYRLKEKEPNKNYNQAFDKYDVGDLFRGLFEKHGLPRGMKMDNGKNFLAEYVQSSLDYLGVEVFLSRPYAGWQKRIERAWGELKDWLLTPEINEAEITPVEKVAKAIELYNKERKLPEEVSPENRYNRPVTEDRLAFAFFEKDTRKVRNGYVTFAGVSFFVGHLLEENLPNLRRGRKKDAPEVLVAVDPKDLTKAWVYIPSNDGEYEWNGKKWKYIGIARANDAIHTDERELSSKAKKVRKKRALKKKAEKLYRKLNEVQSELIEEETKPAKDEFDLLLTEGGIEEDIELIVDTQPKALTLPWFSGPGDVAKWVRDHQKDLNLLSGPEKVRLLGIISQAVSSLPATERDFLLKVAKKLEKEVKAHA